ncbi:hypothetical protein HS088_TW05G00532 [Tripterygium wilfordii]|uniref:Uncharacterized protein n=1 Tax=Tripterygium wilfordii TaxID=458696 RepID=A0A7J7DN63_TRIWF|nr:hypothetical protein HS088_TW05G00532 [Tripterygium wilfordii]
MSCMTEIFVCDGGIDESYVLPVLLRFDGQAEIDEELLSAGDMAQITVIGEDRIVYSSNRDIFEQNLDARDFERSRILIEKYDLLWELHGAGLTADYEPFGSTVVINVANYTIFLELNRKRNPQMASHPLEELDAVAQW